MVFLLPQLPRGKLLSIYPFMYIKYLEQYLDKQMSFIIAVTKYLLGTT